MGLKIRPFNCNRNQYMCIQISCLNIGVQCHLLYLVYSSAFSEGAGVLQSWAISASLVQISDVTKHTYMDKLIKPLISIGNGA